MSQGRYEEKLIGWVRFTGATGAVLNSRGCTVVRNGAGDYQITLEEGGVDSTEASWAACAEVAAVEWAIVHTSDTSKQLLALNNAGAATDPTTVVFKIYQNAFGSGQ